MTKIRKSSEKSYIDLFAGCGGLSLGLHKAGWKGLFAVEKNKDAFETLKINLIENKNHFEWPEWLPIKAYDINYFLKKYSKQLKNYKGKIDLLAGGPPCQGFSSAGRRKENDKRNKLVHSYIKFVRLIKPEIIFFENVIGFTQSFVSRKTKGRNYSNYVIKKLEALGYKVEARLVNFGNYGIPQNRQRYILIGSLRKSPENFFRCLDTLKLNFLKNKNLVSGRVTLKMAISDLLQSNGMRSSSECKGFKEGHYGKAGSAYQKLLRSSAEETPTSHRFANHTEETIKRLKGFLKTCTKGVKIPKKIKEKHGLLKQTIVPLSPSRRSPTLTTLPDDYIHYSEPRILTVREYARIQSFDDWYDFQGPYTTGGKRRKFQVPRYTQVGNAIPPLFMELAGGALTRMTN